MVEATENMTDGKLKQTPVAGGLAIPPGRLLGFDKWISAQMYEYGKGLLRPFLLLLELTGDGLLWLPVVFAAWLSPIQLVPKLRGFLLSLFLGFLMDLIIVGTLKSIIRRPRPHYNRGMSIVVAADRWSFPSGHSSRALLIASFCYLCQHQLEESFSKSDVNKVLAVLGLWAILTALSRIPLGRHYLVDVIFGSMIGVLEALLVVHYLWIPLKASNDLQHLALSCLSLHPSCKFSILRSIIHSVVDSNQ